MAGGPIESIVIAGRRFTTDGEDTCEITYSGYDNEVKPNGDGTQRIVKSVHTGAIEGLNLVIDPARDDMEFLKEQQDSCEFLEVSATLVGGTVINGSMQITDAVALDSKEMTAEVTLNGTCEKL